MRTLLIIAHGSRRQASNEEVLQLADAVRRREGLGFAEVATGFLELAEPTVPDALQGCIDRGATEVIVFPYFLAAGRHVVSDIPEEIGPVQARHPEVSIRVLPHLGASDILPEVILGMASQPAAAS
jgi:sirohydrochlorin ferrochelatase